MSSSLRASLLSAILLVLHGLPCEAFAIPPRWTSRSIATIQSIGSSTQRFTVIQGRDSLLKNSTEMSSTALHVGFPVDPLEIDPQVQLVPENDTPSRIESILSSYLGPRVILLVIAAVYATNFPLGTLMNDNLPASAATTARMVLASLALSPFLSRIKPSLRARAVFCGCFTALGYVTQSLALVDTDPAKVSFLGALTVLWCPLLEYLVDKKPLGIREAPQTWLAAVLCLAGVAMLEAPSADALLTSSWGDLLAVLQAVGFGTGVFLTSKMVNEEPDQALPVTATLVSTTAFVSMIWSLTDGWMSQPGWQSFALPGMLFDPSLTQVAMAVAWTGIISTSLNFFIEITALGRVAPSEASVLLATEPMWAAFFAAVLFHETLGVNDYFGGAFIVAACLANGVLKPTDFFGKK